MWTPGKGRKSQLTVQRIPCCYWSQGWDVKVSHHKQKLQDQEVMCCAHQPMYFQENDKEGMQIWLHLMEWSQRLLVLRARSSSSFLCDLTAPLFVLWATRGPFLEVSTASFCSFYISLCYSDASYGEYVSPQNVVLSFFLMRMVVSGAILVYQASPSLTLQKSERGSGLIDNTKLLYKWLKHQWMKLQWHTRDLAQSTLPHAGNKGIWIFWGENTERLPGVRLRHSVPHVQNI